MHEYKFLLAIETLPEFKPATQFDSETRAIDFPAWRALFTGLVLYDHSTGYRLPDYKTFARLCKKAYTHESHRDRFTRYFDDPLKQKTDQRLRFWYESGMAETYLYACLVDALEDKLREGVVLYDARADWKLKCDLAVFIRRKQFIVDSYWGDRDTRVAIREWREGVERQRKQHTATSSHWNNEELARWSSIDVSRSDGDCQIVNGLRLFSIASINALLGRIYDEAGLPADRRFVFPESREDRKELYLSMLGK